MTNAFAPTQLHYRFQEENGTEATATLLGSEDTNLPRMVTSDSNIQLRIQVNETGSGAIASAANATWQLQRDIAGGGFANVTTTSTGVKVNTSSALTDGGTTTARLTAPTTFNAGQQDDANGAVTFTHAGNVYTEHVFGLTLIAADLANGNVVTFRLLYNGATFNSITNGAYTVTPTLTVDNAVNFTATPDAGAFVLSGVAPAVTADAATSPTSGAIAFAGASATLEAGATAVPGIGAILFAGSTPTVSGGGGLTQRLTPNTILASTNLQDTLTNVPPQRLLDIDDDTGGGSPPDAEWWTAVNPEADIAVRLGFPSPAGNLIGMQQIRLTIRGTSLPSRDVKVELWENGAPAPGSPTVYITESVTSITEQTVTLSFLATELSDLSGAGVEVRISATAA